MMMLEQMIRVRRLY